MELKAVGVFNVMNALASLLTAELLKIEAEVAIKSLENFTGIWRRFEFHGVKRWSFVL